MLKISLFNYFQYISSLQLPGAREMSKDDLQPVRWRRCHPCTAPGDHLFKIKKKIIEYLKFKFCRHPFTAPGDHFY